MKAVKSIFRLFFTLSKTVSSKIKTPMTQGLIESTSAPPTTTGSVNSATGIN
jgi:hypothetical protein